MSETTAPASAAPPNAFNHPRIQELVKKAQTVPGIGQVLIQILYDIVHPGDRILGCFYSFDATAPKAGDPGGSYYAVEVVLVTSAYFIQVALFPKSHTYRKRKVHTVSEVSLRYDPPSTDDLKGLQIGKFVPNNLAMTVVFQDDKGNVVETWLTETTAPEAIRNLFDIQRLLNRCVGFPLAQIPPAALGGSA